MTTFLTPNLGSSSLRPSLRPDCSKCFALCCIALGFSRSIDFAFDKPAGLPCPNLDPGSNCTIHASLLGRGFRGCTVFDCFGAGQSVSQRFYLGISWADDLGSREHIFTAFRIMKQLHEMLWYVEEAADRAYDPGVADYARELTARISALTEGEADALLAADVRTLHEDVRELLIAVSEEVRAPYSADGAALHSELVPGADLSGRSFRSHGLCGADLRGAILITADFRDCDLAAVDLLGADLRDAKLAAADLASALYLTQPQLSAASGSSTTRLPAWLSAPASWSEH